MPFTRPHHVFWTTRRAAAFVSLSLLSLIAVITPAKLLRADEASNDAAKIQRKIDALINDPNAPEEWLELRRLFKEDRLRTSERDESERRIRELRKRDVIKTRQAEIDRLRRELAPAVRSLEEQIEAEAARQHEERVARMQRIAPPQTPQAHALGTDILSYPRVEGSTSTNPLAVIIACRILDVPYTWMGGERAWGHWAVDPAGRFGISGFHDSRLTVAVTRYSPAAVRTHDNMDRDRIAALINHQITRHSGTHEAYVSLITKASDIALIARAPSEEELTLAKEHGVVLEARPVARDALVFLNHRDNAVLTLTLDEIRAIYSGTIRTWEEVGGASVGITPYRREPQSGSQELMEDLVMREHLASLPEEMRMLLVDVTNAPHLIGMEQPYIALLRDDTGIAYSVYYYAYYMIGSPHVRLLGVDGVTPTYDTIRDKSYPLTADVYVVARKDLPEDSPAARWREWLLSPEGQSVVRESGYVPVLETLD